MKSTVKLQNLTIADLKALLDYVIDKKNLMAINLREESKNPNDNPSFVDLEKLIFNIDNILFAKMVHLKND